jgi:hypothetical protein
LTTRLLAEEEKGEKGNRAREDGLNYMNAGRISRPLAGLQGGQLLSCHWTAACTGTLGYTIPSYGSGAGTCGAPIEDITCIPANEGATPGAQTCVWWMEASNITLVDSPGNSVVRGYEAQRC